MIALALLAGCDSSNYYAGIDGSGARIFAQGPIEAFGRFAGTNERRDGRKRCHGRRYRSCGGLIAMRLAGYSTLTAMQRYYGR